MCETRRRLESITNTLHIDESTNFMFKIGICPYYQLEFWNFGFFSVHIAIVLLIN